MKTDPHPFSLRQLQYVVAVAEELSFRRAAARCHVSQPSLSMQLAQAEEALGMRLFERGQGQVVVTSNGRALIERAQRVLLEADELLHAAARSRDPLSGTLRLGIIPTISPYLLPAVTPALRRSFPRLRLAWLEDKTQSLVENLERGELEGAVVALEANIGDVACARIATDPFVLVTAPEHELATSSAPVTEPELRGAELLLLDDGHCFRDQALEACGTAARTEGEFRATSLSTLVQMVVGGAGITLIPALAVTTEARRARLHVRPVASTAARRTIALIWRRGSALEVAMKAVASVLQDSYPATAVARPSRPRRPAKARGRRHVKN
jgi:LysR family hydrogen peroxide-inducible transcriptional activator